VVKSNCISGVSADDSETWAGCHGWKSAAGGCWRWLGRGGAGSIRSLGWVNGWACARVTEPHPPKNYKVEKLPCPLPFALCTRTTFIHRFRNSIHLSPMQTSARAQNSNDNDYFGISESHRSGARQTDRTHALSECGTYVPPGRRLA